MSDPIDRQAAITLPVMPKEHREYQTYNLDDAYEQGWFDLQECIENLPSAQPEIIRCRDCKHWDETWTNDWSPDYHYCPMVDGIHKGDFYCADAERRTDE